MNGKRQQIAELSADIVKGLVLVDSSINEVDSFKLALGDGARFVGKQNVQRACGFNTGDFAHEDIILKHFTHILRGNDSNHQWQTLGHRHNDNDYRQHNRLDYRLNKTEYSCVSPERCGTARVHYDRLEQHSDRYRDTADISEFGNTVCKLAELDLQRSFAVVVRLQLARDLAVDRLIAYDRDLHSRVARAYDSAAVYLVFAVKIGVLVGIRPAFGNCAFFSLAALAVQH